MTIIPAIDILNGACVRLYKGNYNQSKIYNSDPLDMAVKLCSDGCRRLHIVDLDAARGNGKTNRTIIKKIRDITSVTIETGGGIRTETDVEELLDIGIDRLILGTVFAKNPEIAAKCTNKYGNYFIAGIDALDGKVKISGWEEDSSIEDTDLAHKAAENGIISIIYTNIDRDGTLSGPDLDNSIKIAEVSGLPVIVSGGISSEADIEKISNINYPGIKGIITGKAVYENKINLGNVFRNYQSSQDHGVEW